MTLICETCGKSFNSLAHLFLHQRKHKEQQPSVCTVCGKQFSTKDSLKAHTVRKHGMVSMLFYQKTYLKWHLYKHTGQEPYLCDTWVKGWPSAAQIRVHMVQHTEERPFKCEDCGVCYKRRSHLTEHSSCARSAAKPLDWTTCWRSTRESGRSRVWNVAKRSRGKLSSGSKEKRHVCDFMPFLVFSCVLNWSCVALQSTTLHSVISNASLHFKLTATTIFTDILNNSHSLSLSFDVSLLQGISKVYKKPKAVQRQGEGNRQFTQG